MRTITPLRAALCLTCPLLAGLPPASAEPLPVGPGRLALLDETRWTGGAGRDEPFWDLVDNWSSGPPRSADTDALLGTGTTTLRDGSFEARRLVGEGVLLMTGGALSLGAGASTLDRLDFRSGSIDLQELSVRTLRWSGGSFVRRAAQPWGTPGLTVSGTAQLSGALDYSGLGQLRLNGKTTWQSGASSIVGSSPWVIGTAGTIEDDAGTAGHEMRLSIGGRLVNEGRYLKSGRGTTQGQFEHSDVENRGTFDVLGGTMNQNFEFAAWRNDGTLNIENATLTMTGYQADFRNGGTVNVGPGGRFRFASSESGVYSSGTWTVSRGGEVDITDSARRGASPGNPPSIFSTGTIHNDGTVVFRGAGDLGGAVVLQQGVALSGRGTIAALDGIDLRIDNAVDVGGLRISAPRSVSAIGADPLEHVLFSRVRIDGAIRLDELDWQDGHLDTTGPVTVSGVARLSNDPRYFSYMRDRPLGKQIDTDFTFLQQAVWDGNADIFGTGSIRVGPGARFEDRNAAGTREYQGGGWVPRYTQIAVSRFVNEGSFEKTGAGETVIEARLDNLGRMTAIDAAPLILAGRTSNTGTLEAVRSRVVVWGPLEQLQQGQLRGGRYIARDGTLVFNLGPEGPVPHSITENHADIVLDGPHARLATVWRGTDQNALRSLELNDGTITLLGGARLSIGGPLRQSGVLHIGAGSTLSAAALWQSPEQEEDRPAVWLAGVLDAPDIRIFAGRFSAGAEDEVGRAAIRGQLLLSGRTVLDIASVDRFDVLDVDGAVAVGGELWLAFEGDQPVLGTFRFLTTSRGLTGAFAAVHSDLDAAAYRLDARYGDNFAEITVSAVPEPSSVTLLVLGAGWLMARRCRRAARTPGHGRTR